MNYKIEYIQGVGKDKLISHYKLTVYKNLLFFKYSSSKIFFDENEMKNYIKNKLV